MSRKKTQPLMNSRVYHVIVRRQSPDEELADALADKAVEASRSSIEKVGGTISASHTFQVAHSYVVIELPDGIDIAEIMPGYEVKEFN